MKNNEYIQVVKNLVLICAFNLLLCYSVSAQAVPGDDCGPFRLDEITVELVDGAEDLTLRIEVYNELSEKFYEFDVVSRSNCDWRADTGSSNDNRPGTDVFLLDEAGGEILWTIIFSRVESKFEENIFFIAGFTYSLCNTGNSAGGYGFYCMNDNVGPLNQNGNVSNNINSDVKFIYDGNDIYTRPEPISFNLASENFLGVENLFDDVDRERWIFPLNGSDICDRLSTNNCDIDESIISWRVFLTRQFGNPITGELGTPRSRSYDIIDEDVEVKVLSGRTWDLGGESLKFQPGRELRVEGAIGVGDISLISATAGNEWGGVNVPTGGEVVIRDDIRIVDNQTLRLRGAGAYEFTNGAQIVVEGGLDAEGVAFQAQNSTGWGGIRFESGSSGILSGGSITGVSNPCGTGACLDAYAVSLNNASVVMNDLRITTPIGSGVGGIYAYGQNTLLDMERVEVRDMTGRGLGLVNRATARVRSSRFINNLGDGISVLNRATAFIRQAEENFPAETSDNGLRGILAASRGTAILGEQGGCSAPFCANAATDGYVLVEDNDREGLRINSNSTINAGGTNAYRFNTIQLNASSQVRVSGSGADLFMNADFWGGGEPVPIASNGGAFFYTSYCLDEPTFGQGCTIEDVDSVPTRQGGTSAEAFYALAGADALRAQGHTKEAALAFADLARRYPGTPEATSSLARLGRLTSELDTPAQRQTLRFLDGETRQRGAVHEHAALAALAGALADLGQTEAAVTVAADLTARAASLSAADFGGSAFDAADSGDEDPVLEAQIVGPETAFYAWMDVEDFAAAEASWAELVALAPDHEATAAAREAFAFVVGRVPAGAARVGGATARATPAQESVTVWPNPADARATVGVALAEETAVRVTVVDVLGREVAVVHAGRLAAGRHTLTFDTRRLAAGVYVVRAEQPNGATTTRLTVVR